MIVSTFRDRTATRPARLVETGHNRLAKAAAAGLALLSASPVLADGTAASCCQDLEERIAELETLSARKGNRKVRLTVSGLIDEAFTYWNDGRERNLYQVTNEHVRTRFRFTGEADVASGWTAGYLIELGARGANAAGASQTTDDGAPSGLDLRHMTWWLQKKDLGRVWVGQTSTAADLITEIDTAGISHVSIPELQNFIGGYFVRRSDTGNLSTLRYTDLVNIHANPGEGTRYNVVKYDTPTIAGFVATVAVGEDKMWDAGLRFAGAFHDFKLAGGIAYGQWTDGNSLERGCANLRTAGRPGASDVDCSELGLSASAMHLPSGIYLTGAFGQRHDGNRNDLVAGADADDRFYNIKGGVQHKWLPLGATSLRGEYYRGAFGTNIGVAAAGLQSSAPLGVPGQFVSGFELSMWGVGIDQAIDAASMNVYLMFREFEASVDTSATGAAAGSRKTDLDALQLVTAGAIIRF